MYSKSDIENIYPLTPVQEGILFHSASNGSSSGHNIFVIYEVLESLMIELLKKSFYAVIRRHDILRAVITTKLGDRPLQLILKNTEPKFEVFDLSDLSDNQKQIDMASLIEKSRSFSFDLTSDCLIKLTVIKTSATSYTLIINYHHIIMDGWSFMRLEEEFWAYYNSFVSGTQYDPESRPFSEYIKWLSKKEDEVSFQYWKRYLYGFEGSTGIPKTNLRLDNGKSSADFTYVLDEKVTTRLRDLGRRMSVTGYSVIQAIWAIILASYNNCFDVVFGSVTSGRPPDLDGVDRMIGPFINLIPVRIKFDSSTTFADLIRDTHAKSWEGQQYQHISLAGLLSKIGLQSKIFDHIISYQNFLPKEVSDSNSQGVPDLVLRGVMEKNNYDFSIVFQPGKELIIRFSFNPQYYTPSFVERIAIHFRTVVDKIVDYPQILISEIDILGPDEATMIESFKHSDSVSLERAVATTFKEKFLKTPDVIGFVKLFENRVEQTPDQIALVFEQKFLSYAKLNEMVNQFAHWLKVRMGLLTQDLIAIQLQRSEWLSIAILGIVKAGAAYLPIDPTLPAERRNYMIKDSGAKLLISDINIDDINECVSVNLFECDLDNQADHNLDFKYGADKLIYTIYTSGSTGRPKGVMIPLQAVDNLVNWLGNTIYRGNNSMTAILNASISFDASVQQLFAPVIYGSRLVIVPDEVRKNPELFINYIVKHDGAILDITPSHFNLLLGSEGVNELTKHLKYSIVAGEPLSQNTVRKYFEVFEDSPHTLIHAYGITECGVNSTYGFVNRSHVTIGWPLPNNAIYILDDNRRLKPIGVYGEIFIGGVGLGLGYLNNPELTSECFVENPYERGKVLYRTGDFGRWLDDGSIDFLGRRDGQIKIRGHRVEIGEVEQSLLSHPGIKEVVVKVERDGAGDGQLTAYYTSKERLTNRELRNFQKRHLPVYMLPALYVELVAFPLTTQGKIDKDKLILPKEHVADPTESVGPSNEIEQRILRIWQNVLGISVIDTNDDFFEIGGHSLNAIRLVSSLNKEFLIDVSLDEIFANSTVRDLAILVGHTAKDLNLITAIEEQEFYDLPIFQRRLWILDQMLQSKSAYNVSLTYNIDGRFDTLAFDRALDTLVSRHEILRTIFIECDGEPKQKILTSEALRVSANCHTIGPDVSIAGLLDQKVKEIFDLSKGPLFRVNVITNSQKETIVFMVFHHIICDEWSIQVLINELIGNYLAIFQEGVAKSMPLKIQSKDCAVWLRDERWKKKEQITRAYWRDKLSGILPVLELPTHYPRPPIKKYEGRCHSFVIDNVSVERLKSLSADEKTTLFVTLLSLIKTLLFRYTGQTDIVIGAPVSLREHEQLLNQVGFYLNTLPLRTTFKEDDTFLELLQKVKTTAVDAFSHRFYPFDILVEELKIRREQSRTPLFDVEIAVGRNLEDPVVASQQRADNIDDLKNTIHSLVPARDDLTFLFEDEGSELRAHIFFDVALFNDEWIERLASNFVKLLKSCLKNTRQKLYELDILSDDEKRKLTREFGGPGSMPPFKESVIDLFKESAKKYPDKVCVVTKETFITYSELDKIVECFASYLVTQYAVRPNRIVCLALARSERMIISILAILRIGAIYCPIDIKFPTKRINSIISDLNSDLLITDNSDREFTAEKVVQLEERWNEILNFHPWNLDVVTDHWAYVISTSGSSGTPKGILTHQRGVVNYIKWMKDKYGFDGRDGILQWGSYCFDSSVADFFVSLCFGIRLILCDEKEYGDPHALERLFIKYDISSFFVVTSFFQRMVESSSEHSTTAFGSLKNVFVGGEPLLNATAMFFRKHFGGKLHNLYGPTETTIAVTSYEVNGDESSIPIGKPMTNTKLYVLDRFNKLQPIGVSGEICISGVSVGAGYVNQVEFTRSRFIDNPFDKGILYRTGDLGRWLEDGNLELLGRVDSQVKIRGYRIELSEIERTLMNHDLVKEAIVKCEIDAGGETQLIAYYTSKKALPSNELKRHLMEDLPGYMLPARYIPLEKFELSSSGKIDRNKLIVPPEVRQAVEVGEPSKNLIQLKICKVWQEVLGLDSIRITDNFFEIGGHSLRAIKLVSILNKEFLRSFSLNELLTNPTIEALAALVNDTPEESNPLSPVEEQEYYDLPVFQRRLWILDKVSQNSAAYNVPIVLRAEGQFDVMSFESSLLHLIVKHEILRTILVTVEDLPRQKVIDPETFRFETESLIVGKGMKVDEIIEARVKEPFDLSVGPLLRASILTVSPNENIILIVFHHIICDEKSILLFVSELASHFNRSHSNGYKTTVPLRIQYKDSSVWLQTELNKRWNGMRAYWHSKLAGELPVLNLPTKVPRPLMKTYSGDHYTFNIDGEIYAGLKKMSQQKETTLFVTLLSLIKILLYRYSGQTDIVVGCPVSLREHVDMQDQVGFYINTLALRTVFSDGSSFLDVLQKVRATTVEALSNRFYPFDLLVEDLRQKRDPSRSPLFDVEMVFGEMFVKPFHESNAAAPSYVSETDIQWRPAKFDLTFYFNSTEGDGLQTDIVYCRELFSREWIQRMSGHINELARSVLFNPKQPINSVDFLPPFERKRLVVDFNHPDINAGFVSSPSEPEQKSIIARFESRVVQTPDQIALVFEQNFLTYSKLNELVNQFAHWLKGRLEVSPSEIIAIQLRRSEWLSIAVLSIVKAGAAYLPIDPSFPVERRKFMIRDSGAKLLLSDTDLGDFDECVSINLFQLDLSNQVSHNLDVEYSPDGLIYAIYTSGSTGRPKGVMIPLRAVDNLVNWLGHNIYKTNDRMTAVLNASISFDASVQQLFAPLIYGSRLVITSDEVRTDPDLFVKNIVKYDGNILDITPSHFNLLLGSPSVKDLTNHLRYTIVAGESLKEHTVKKYLNVFENSPHSLIHAYGITECGVNSTYTFVDSSHTNIGWPLPNHRIFILNEDRQLMPVGVYGQIFISGIGLALGYLNNPELTRDCFVENPFDPAELLYRTGDFARWLEDGSIDFLGRQDDQVKIRGHRIELSEIETWLLRNPLIDLAVVRYISTSNELVAYYTLKDKSESVNLRAWLQIRLPEYMLPEKYIKLESFSLNRSGKVEIQSLPEPSQNIETNVLDSDEKAGNLIEMELVRIWQDVLGAHPIGINDNFFEKGGNSFKAVALQQKMKAILGDLGESLEVRSIFEKPTISLMTQSLSRNSTLRNEFGLNGFIKMNEFRVEADTLFCLSPAIGIPLIFSPFALKLESEFNCFGSYYPGIDRSKVIFKTREIMTDWFADSLSALASSEEIFILGYSWSGKIAFELTKKMEERGKKVSLIFLDCRPGVVQGYETEQGFEDDFKMIKEKHKSTIEDLFNMELIERIYFNNSKLFSDYEAHGIVRANVLAFEAKGARIKSNMKEWAKFTTGNFYHYFLPTDHEGIWNYSNRMVKRIKTFRQMKTTLFSPGANF